MPGKNRDVNLNVTATEETGPATAAAGRNIDGLQRKVDGFNTKKPTAEVTRFTSAFTKSAKDGDSAMTTLQKAIDDTERRIAKIRTDFSGSGSNGIQLFGDLKQETANLRTLQSALSAFTAEGEKAGSDFSQSVSKTVATKLPSGLGDALSNPATAAAVGAAIIGLSGPISAVLAGAISGGIGLGVIGAAAVIERNEPHIVAALSPLERDVKDAFSGAAAGLVPDFVSALNSIDSLVNQEAPQIAKLFGAVSGAVSPLVSGVETLVSDLLPAATKDAAAFVSALNDPKVVQTLHGAEQAVVGLFTEIGNNPELVADGFKLIGVSVDLAATSLTDFLRVGEVVEQFFSPLLTELEVVDDLAHGHFTTALHDFTSSGLDASTAASDLQKALNTLQTGAQGAASAVGQDSTALNKVQAAAQTATAAVDDYLSTVLGASNANLSAATSLSAIKSGWEKVHGPIDLANKAWQTDLGLVNSAISSAQGVFDSTQKQTGSVDKATLAYDKQIDSLHDTLAAMGLTETQIDGLIGQYAQIPSQISTDVSVIGVPAAKAAAKGVEDALSAIAGDWDATVHIRVAESAASAQLISRATGQHAAFGQGDYLSSDFAFGTRGGDGANSGARWSMPPAQIDVNNNLRSTLLLDGRVVADSYDRTRSHQRHAAKVGAL